MKYLVGFVLGLSAASLAALAQDTVSGSDIALLGTIKTIGTYLNAGVGPDNHSAPIRVDAEGHVICSTETTSQR